VNNPTVVAPQTTAATPPVTSQSQLTLQDGAWVLLPFTTQSSGSVSDPSQIFTTSLKMWHRADDLAPGAVGSWLDRTTNHNDFSQGTTANKPTASASGGPNSTAEVTFDGVNDYLANTTLDFPAPGTQPYYLWLILKQITWTNGRRICEAPDFGVAAVILAQDIATPQITMDNNVTANNNAGSTIGSYTRLEAQFTNSTSDYLKIGSTTVTGSNAGNSNPTAVGVNMAADKLGTSNGNISIAEWLVVFGTPSAAQRAQLDAYAAARYGAGVTA
jgi:hypothetical protein